MNASVQAIPLLVAELRAAKQQEDKAKEHRLSIEKQITDLFPQGKGFEGTVKEGDLSIAFKVTRSVDTEKLQESWDSLNANARKAFKWKADIDLRQYRAIGELDAPSFAQISAFVTTKDAKPSITLKD